MAEILDNPLLTKEETAHYLKVSLRTLDNLVKGGKITPTKVGKFSRFQKQEIQSFIDRSSNSPRPKS
jgi:excisionase family DNA binding protein